MFNIARVKFMQSSGQPIGGNASKLYDYRIPKHLDGIAKVGDLAIVSWKGVRGEGGQINPGLGKIEEICNVLDGDYSADASYAYLVGVVDPSRHEQLLASERRRERLQALIRAERKRVAETMELESLLGLSPDLRDMVDELKKLDRAEEADTFADALDSELGRVSIDDRVVEKLNEREAAAVDAAAQRQIDRNGN